ncbi:hypothetical protein NDU88_007370 [Pleurodeles waltl]|uniref:Uncharacterized protein n=1 Tax=Pleurodeles waltl TaxID=8319 RepID=A0AAV7QRF8_PLEWA|nr:hypothetical protein NDU88_007370 [Pleurodeles waltl]
MGAFIPGPNGALTLGSARAPEPEPGGKASTGPLYSQADQGTAGWFSEHGHAGEASPDSVPGALPHRGRWINPRTEALILGPAGALAPGPAGVTEPKLEWEASPDPLESQVRAPQAVLNSTTNKGYFAEFADSSSCW